MNRKVKMFSTLLLLALWPDVASAATDDRALREQIAARLPGVQSENVAPSPIPGLYEVAVGPMVVYVSADGRYLVQGEIHDLETDENVTAGRIEAARAKALKGLGDDDVIVFGGAELKHSVTIFTDVSCGYCRVLHSKVEEYNKRGIQVRYAAFPRNGLGSDAWAKMEEVWCAPDRQKALTMAKLDRDFPKKPCNSDNVTEQWQLGRMMGVRGTPAIFTASGQMIPGYLPPDELLKRIQSGQTKPRQQ